MKECHKKTRPRDESRWCFQLVEVLQLEPSTLQNWPLEFLVTVRFFIPDSYGGMNNSFLSLEYI